jgi:hypothetical protein
MSKLIRLSNRQRTCAAKTESSVREERGLLRSVARHRRYLEHPIG